MPCCAMVQALAMKPSSGGDAVFQFMVEEKDYGEDSTRKGTDRSCGDLYCGGVSLQNGFTVSVH